MQIAHSPSPRYKLNKTDLKKIGTGLLIATLGATITYLTDLIPNIDWGNYTPLVVAFWSVVVNFLRKYFKGHEEAFKQPSLETPELQKLLTQIQEQKEMIETLKLELKYIREKDAEEETITEFKNF